MKPLKEALINKDIIKNYKNTISLNKPIESFDELVIILNTHLRNYLKKPIKTIKSEVVFKEYRYKTGIQVDDHFTLEFNNIKVIFRFGIHGGKYLYCQAGYKDKNTKYVYGARNPYVLGDKIPFITWMNEYLRERMGSDTKDYIMKMFN